MSDDRQIRFPMTADLVAPLFTALLGMAMFAMGLTQPAWLDGRIGPGLFARWLSAAVVAMSLIWLVVALMQRRSSAAKTPAAHGSDARKLPSLAPGLGLLAGVVLFALALPVTGLVVACALTAVVVSWGAGDRALPALLAMGLAGAGAALALGLTLLPPGTRLWPPGL